jgi:hypothetical protein
MIMNTKLLLFAGLATGLALQFCPTAGAETFSSGTLDDIIPIPPAAGLAAPIDVTGLGGNIDSVTVSLDIAGAPTAYNGDYYAYLQFGSSLDVLFNLIDNGSGNNAGNGMNVTFSDTGSLGSIQSATVPSGDLTGSYIPDGGLDSTFGGLPSADGAWTLFIADESPGGVGELVNWSVTLTAPDEGSTMLLLGLGVGFLGLCSLLRSRAAAVNTIN